MPHITNESDYYTTAYLVYLGEIATSGPLSAFPVPIPGTAAIAEQLFGAPDATSLQVVNNVFQDVATATVVAKSAIDPRKPTYMIPTAITLGGIGKAMQLALKAVQPSVLTTTINSKLLQTVMTIPALQTQPSFPIVSAKMLGNIFTYIKPVNLS